VTYMKNIAIAAVTEANKRVYEKSNESASFSGMGTTLVGAVVDGNKAVIVNVGDSRAYLVNRENIMKISKDHSLVEEMLSRGDITEEQARVHPNKNLITRALGAEPSIRVDSFVVTLKNNQYLLLCSDGLTNMLSDQEIKQEILNGGLPEKCCERLVKSAVEHGGMDNISVILLLL
ncbi:MAG: protein phosphatase 2C domain-containing protein, partial [Clostridiales bacterium]|nr:protein phosphatase 2C domain-containing protein [Clostridiales bacterium]